MKQKLKELWESIKVIGIILLIVTILSGIGFISFKLWRAEHPNAPTWTFFINNHK